MINLGRDPGQDLVAQYLKKKEDYRMEDIELCESCEENPGVLNSSFWKEEEEAEGHRVCELCERELAEEHEEWARSMASVYENAYAGPEKSHD